jgi:hypothetical protein
MSAKTVRGRGVSAVPADLIKGGAMHQAHTSKGFAGIGFRLVCDSADRVNRGGGWDDGVPASARVANRGSDAPGYRDYYLGFRLVKDTA